MRQLTTASALQAKAQPNANILADRAAHRLANFMPIFILGYLPAVLRSCLCRHLFSCRSPSFPLTCDVVLDRRWIVLVGVFYFLVFFFLRVATFIAFPFLSGFGSFLRFLAAAFALFFFPSEYALDLGRHFGLPSLLDPLAHGPLIFPSGPNLTHLSLNHFLRFSFNDSANIN